MSEVLGGHEIVCFNSFFNVVTVDTDGNTHDHMLRTFGDFTVDPQKIGTLLSAL
jgi:hypothetical protein